MRFAGSIIILLLILALAAYSFYGRAGTVAVGKLGVEQLFDVTGVELDENLQRDIAAYREVYAKQGFMALYRECYSIALDAQKFDFDRQFAAVSCLLVISQYELDSGTLRASAQRLFINFCRMSLVDKIIAVQINEITENYGLFSDNSEVKQLWNDYLQYVWDREVRPRIRRYGVIDEHDQRFIELRATFAAEAATLLNRHDKTAD